jgi:hypothetical protein
MPEVRCPETGTGLAMTVIGSSVEAPSPLESGDAVEEE